MVKILILIIVFLLGCLWYCKNFSDGKYACYDVTGWKKYINIPIAILIGWHDTDSWYNPYMKIMKFFKRNK